MKFLIMGSGAVGGYFGARLHEAGEEVWFVARGDHLRALKGEGLRVDSFLGDFVVKDLQATDRPALAGEVDCIIVAVKAWQTTAAAAAIQANVGPQTSIFSLQNGITPAQEITAVVGPRAVMGAACEIQSFLQGPGHLVHAGVAPHIFFGELDGVERERGARLAEVFARCRGMTATLERDVRPSLWYKFMRIAAISGVGAVTRSKVGEVRSVPETRQLLVGAVAESARVAEALGVELGADIVERAVAFIDQLPAAATASMQRDLMEGRPSELEAQNGALVRLGERAGVATPVHRFLYAALKPMESRARTALDAQSVSTGQDRNQVGSASADSVRP